MSKRKKYPSGHFKKIWWQISTYNEQTFLRFFRRREFYIYASTPNQAQRKLKETFKDAQVSVMSPIHKYRVGNECL